LHKRRKRGNYEIDVAERLGVKGRIFARRLLQKVGSWLLA